MTINQALVSSQKKLNKKNINNSCFDAEILLSHVIKKTREYIFTYPEKKLTKFQIKKFNSFIDRRLKNEPVAYIIRIKEFYGLDFFVNKNVLVPRPETELIVDEVLKLLKKTSNTICIDLGTGSGCIIISIAKKLGVNKLIAVDISKRALNVAIKNSKKHHIFNKIKFLHGNLLDPVIKNNELKSRQNILITANLPYLTPIQIKNSPSIQNEPKIALDGGDYGIKYYKKLFKQIKLLPKFNSCTILCEIDPSQLNKIKQLAKRELPNLDMRIKKDLTGRDRLLIIKIRN